MRSGSCDASGDLGAKAMPGQAVESRTTGEGVRLLVYDAPDRERPGGALLWIHGAAWSSACPSKATTCAPGSPRRAGVFVASVEYRLAPEHPFPAALDDCSAALRWLHQEADVLGIDPSRIAVGGDSAGAGLAAALCSAPSTMAAHQWPSSCSSTRCSTTARCCGPISTPDGVYLWTPASNRYGWTAYLGAEPSLDVEPPAHAVPARREDLAGLPPAWVGVGDLDLFLDEDVAYARRLEAAGVPCELLVVPGMWHGADSIMPSAGPRGGSATPWSMPSPGRSATVGPASLPDNRPWRGGRTVNDENRTDVVIGCRERDGRGGCRASSPAPVGGRAGRSRSGGRRRRGRRACPAR